MEEELLLPTAGDGRQWLVNMVEEELLPPTALPADAADGAGRINTCCSSANCWMLLRGASCLRVVA